MQQESPAVADKPARRESMPKIAPKFDVLTTLSLTILVYPRSFSCCCIRNLRNSKKFSENSMSSKVIDLGANRKRICTFLLATNSNFGRISYGVRVFEIFTVKDRKLLILLTPLVFNAP